MSDQARGPDWWQASNGLWYAPERRPAEPLPPPPDGEPRWDRRPVRPGEGHPLVNIAVFVVLLVVVAAIVRAVN